MKPFFRHVLVLVTGTTLAQSLAVVASPILTRLYSPQEFGLLTVYIAILAIFALLGTLQYENAIPLPEDDESAANLLVLSFIILLCMCLMSGIVLWLGQGLLIKLLHTNGLASFLWLIPFSLLGIGTYNILNRWCVRRKTFGRIAKTKVTQSVGMMGTMITAGFLKQGVLGLLLGDVMGRVGGSGRLTYLLLKEDGPVLRGVTMPGIWQAATRYKRFPLISVGSSLIRELCEQMPALFLAMNYGPQVVGWFMLVQRILGMPLSLIGYSVGNVYTAEVAAHIQKNDVAQILKLYWQILKHLFIIALPLLTLLSLCAPGLFPYIFGTEWHEAGVYLRLLAPMFLLQFLSIPVSTTLYVLERQDLQLGREIIRFGLLFSGMVVATWLKLSSKMALCLLSIAGSLAFLIYAFTSWLAIKQYRQAADVTGEEA